MILEQLGAHIEKYICKYLEFCHILAIVQNLTRLYLPNVKEGLNTLHRIFRMLLIRFSFVCIYKDTRCLHFTISERWVVYFWIRELCSWLNFFSCTVVRLLTWKSNWFFFSPFSLWYSCNILICMFIFVWQRFDVDVPGNMVYKESRFTTAGDYIVPLRQYWFLVDVGIFLYFLL